MRGEPLAEYEAQSNPHRTIIWLLDSLNELGITGHWQYSLPGTEKGMRSIFLYPCLVIYDKAFI